MKGSARLRIQEFLRIVRDEPAQPTLIQIVNAREIGATEKVLRVVTDDSGKMTGGRKRAYLLKKGALYRGRLRDVVFMVVAWAAGVLATFVAAKLAGCNRSAAVKKLTAPHTRQV